MAVLESAVALLSGEHSVSIEALTAELHDYDKRALSATLLGWFGSAARGALPTLVDLASFINNASGEARQAALRIGGAEPEVLRQLEEGLTDGDDQVVRNLFALGIDLGMQEIATFQALVRRAAESPIVDMRDAAANVIAALRPAERQACRSVLKQLRNDTDPEIRAAAQSAEDPPWNAPNTPG
jgi:hypothetical protein